MLKIATAEEMQKIDRTTIERYGISGMILMERAGLAVVSKINELLLKKTETNVDPKIIVLCGSGNNGGDGFVVARILHNQGKDVEVYLTANPNHLKGDALINYKAAKKFGVRLYPVKRFLSYSLPLTSYPCLIVDALLGTGLKKEVSSTLSQIINKVKDLALPVISIDIPSGISANTGQIMGNAIKAQVTVTFGLSKRGHYLYPGAEHAGKLFMEEIGFPRELLISQKIRVNLTQKEDIYRLLPERPEHSHKGTYGHVLIIGGSRGKTGAALMAAKACLRTGAGLVTIGLPETLVRSFQTRVTEEMILPLPDKGNGTLSYKAADVIINFLKKRADVLAVGPGLSIDDEIVKLVCMIVTGSKVPIVIDADGLNAISGRTGVLRNSRSPLILTPHTGEMARLLQRSAISSQQSERKLRTIIEQDSIGTALSFSKKTKTHLVLKGAPTIIADPEGNIFINPTGNPGMATAGAGDVLTGMISALLAQKMLPHNAAILGVYMHGLAGDIIAQKKGEHSLIASDIINAIPMVFRSLMERTV